VLPRQTMGIVFHSAIWINIWL